MVIPTVGGVYYAPHNTIVRENEDAGFAVSTENNVSLLGGLKALRYLLVVKGYMLGELATLDSLIASIESYVKSSYSPTLNFFRQGGTYDPATKVFTWAADDTQFAVDCQSWTMSNVHPLKIDEWFGTGKALSIWETTKILGGYKYDPNTRRVHGLGFTNNDRSVFSGEWTLGAINMLRIMAEIYPASKNELILEANQMRDSIQQELAQTQFIDGMNVKGIAYANKRYFIPFGWWANPVLSTASTGWTVLVDKSYNPFYLGGDYLVNYPK